MTDQELDRRLRTLVPPEYHDTYTRPEVRPMSSAPMVLDADGRVAWDQMWQSFCDLALAGGPPHKGRLLEPGSAADVGTQPDAYLDVIDELGRGITLASELPADDAPELGWIRVTCHSEVMAAWMLRAITMENVAVRAEGRALDLPAAPSFRIEKEIKNVITVVAKTSHYWMGHLPREQKVAIGALFESLEHDEPLIVPDWSGERPAWRGVVCASVIEALQTAQHLVAANILARREDATVFVPNDTRVDPGGLRVDAIIRSATRQRG